jgi:hypothetical protein
VQILIEFEIHITNKKDFTKWLNGTIFLPSMAIYANLLTTLRFTPNSNISQDYGLKAYNKQSRKKISAFANLGKVLIYS